MRRGILTCLGRPSGYLLTERESAEQAGRVFFFFCSGENYGARADVVVVVVGN